MATKIRKTHFVLTLIATWIDSFKRAVTAPGAAVVDATTGTGYATAAQVVTTTQNFTAAANAYAGHWLLVQGLAPCLIVSHPAAAAAPLVLTVFGAAPATGATAFKILRAPSPGGLSGAVHYDRGEWTVSVANASDLATSLALTKALAVSILSHFADDLGHVVPDTANAPSETIQEVLAAIVDLTSAIDTANGLKESLNLHFVQSGVHPINDTTRSITSSDATDQSSLNTLLNELKTDFNAHIADGVATPSWRMVD